MFHVITSKNSLKINHDVTSYGLFKNFTLNNNHWEIKTLIVIFSYIFWVSGGDSAIYRAQLDGTLPSRLVEDDTELPQGITVDVRKKRLVGLFCSACKINCTSSGLEQ